MDERLKALLATARKKRLLLFSRLLDLLDDDDQQEQTLHAALQAVAREGIVLINDLPSAFTLYWNRSTCREMARRGTVFPDHLTGTEIARVGAKPGDYVYVITVRNGHLHVLGRVEIDEIVGPPAAWETYITHGKPDFEAGRCLARTATSLRYHRRLPRVLLSRVRFLTDEGPCPPRFIQPNLPDEQSFFGVRRVAPETALYLDGLVDRDRLHEFHPLRWSGRTDEFVDGFGFAAGTGSSGAAARKAIEPPPDAHLRNEDRRDDAEPEPGPVHLQQPEADDEEELEAGSPDEEEVFAIGRLLQHAEHLAESSDTYDRFVQRLDKEWREDAASSPLEEFETWLRRTSQRRLVANEQSQREWRKVDTAREFYERARARLVKQRMDPDELERLGATLRGGISRDDAFEILSRHCTRPGRRWITRSWFDRRVRPLLHEPITPRQARLLHSLAQSAVPQAQTLWKLRRRW